MVRVARGKRELALCLIRNIFNNCIAVGKSRAQNADISAGVALCVNDLLAVDLDTVVICRNIDYGVAAQIQFSVLHNNAVACGCVNFSSVKIYGERSASYGRVYGLSAIVNCSAVKIQYVAFKRSITAKIYDSI